MQHDFLNEIYTPEEMVDVYPYDDELGIVGNEIAQEIPTMSYTEIDYSEELTNISNSLDQVNQSLGLLITISVCAFIIPWLKSIANKFGGVS